MYCSVNVKRCWKIVYASVSIVKNIIKRSMNGVNSILIFLNIVGCVVVSITLRIRGKN